MGKGVGCEGARVAWTCEEFKSVLSRAVAMPVPILAGELNIHRNSLQFFIHVKRICKILLSFCQTPLF